MAESNVAVLIDYENVGLDSVEGLLDQLSDVGRATVKRAYADWSVQRGKRDQLLELGIEAVHHFRSAKSGKNSSDICLAIDAVDLLYSAPVDTFVIVSSDSDFVPLVSKLRAAGKSVVGSGRRGAASPTLVKSCDRYIYLDDPKPTVDQPIRTESRGSRTQSLVVRALEASMDGQGQVVGSKLFQTMQRIDPSFDYKALGHRNFTQFLDASTEVKVHRSEGRGDVIVQPIQPRDSDTEGPSTNGASLVTDWDRRIESAWTGRQRSRLSGQVAAADAAKVLGVPRLAVSRFPSLDKLLDASPYLRSHWRREGNAILKL